ncbi:MAG TPA: SOS response-associated peptidase [Gammaproteobacteria bacterium]
MCGRFLTPDESAFERYWHVAPPDGYRQSFNVAPTQLAAIVRRRSDGSREAALFTWGFRPAWANRHWINARAETVFTSAAFKRDAAMHRCLVPAAGWYEWQGGATPKVPYVHYRDGFAPIAFAGIWTGTGRAGEPGSTRSFAILTRPAVPSVAFVHGRMPVVLDPAHYDAWLDPASRRADLEHMLLEPRLEFESRRISTYVNKPEHDDPACVAPAA